MNRFRQLGLSLIELTISLCIVGVGLTFVHQILVDKRSIDEQEALHGLLMKSRRALLGFVYLNNRLPCPALDADGWENCDGRTDGQLPFKTLGMASNGSAAIGYSMQSSRDLLSPPGYTPLVAIRDSDGHLAAQKTALDRLNAKENDHSLDICSALMRDDKFNQIAFKISAGSGIKRQFSSDLGYEMTRSTLGVSMRCPDVLAVSGHAVFNAHLAASTMAQALADYKIQYDQGMGLTYWDFAQGVWFAVNSTYSSARAFTKLTFGISTWFGSYLTNIVPMLESMVAIPTTVGYTAVQYSNLGRFTANLVLALDNRVQMNSIVASANALNAELRSKSISNASSRFFFNEQSQVYDGAMSQIKDAEVVPFGIGLYGDVSRNFLADLGKSLLMKDDAVTK